MTASVTRLPNREQVARSARSIHPSGRVPFSPMAKALVHAAGLITQHRLTDPAKVEAYTSGTGPGDGEVLYLDYTGTRTPIANVRIACQALGIAMDETAAETPDGCAAIEVSGRHVSDSVVTVVKAVVEVQADWPVSL